MGNSTFWGPDWDSLQNQDPEIASLLLKELERARGGLQLIASENFTSPAVLAALGSTFSNKAHEWSIHHAAPDFHGREWCAS